MLAEAVLFYFPLDNELPLRRCFSWQRRFRSYRFQILSELVAFLFQELQTFLDISQHRRLEGYL